MQTMPLPDHRIVAVLGPTNTGKTHFAMERLLAHASGMIGFPLRLLARENYERARALKGEGKVALITGEEKIVPPGARYFLCTTESMPLERAVDFLAVDEIQMCADPERGHVFTQRLLDARGSRETMFLGALSMRIAIRSLIGNVEFLSRPRLSTLSYAGERKLSKLPPKTAVVAFSAADVYAIAEGMRRHRGGAAIVMGALSPRTRNAQVAMYQAGEVDHLVATDAIGMGLNMDVDHVAFAATHKFDGRRQRTLTTPELAQIAGRAGRHMNDGTFGVTAGARPLDPAQVEDIEGHRFRAIERIYWRNPDLDIRSLATLQASLAMPPEMLGLARARAADDETALALLARDADIAGLASTADGVSLLWQVCQIPDFRQVMSDAHAALLGRIYARLMDDAQGGPGRLPEDWIADQVRRLERTDGDIETLTGRLANIRTWTYVAHRGDWLGDPKGWQERTRAVEDGLSDALHERLTQRFVDRRTTHLVRRLKDPGDLPALVDAGGEVAVEGHVIGRLDGFRFIASKAVDGTAGAAGKSIAQAAERSLSGEIGKRLARLEVAPDKDIVLRGYDLLWCGERIARLQKGDASMRPGVRVGGGDLIDGPGRMRIRARLERWLGGRLGTLQVDASQRGGPGLAGAARGLLFQLGENFGWLVRADVRTQIAALSRDDRQRLRKAGVVVGRESVYRPELLKPARQSLAGILWALDQGLDTPPEGPPPGRVSVPIGTYPPGLLRAMGYRSAGPLALRIDMLERLSAKAWAAARKGPFAASAEMMSLTGSSPASIASVLGTIGFAAVTVPTGDPAEADGAAPTRFTPKAWQRRQRQKPAAEAAKPGTAKSAKSAKSGTGKPRKQGKRRTPAYDPTSPFAVLKGLALKS